MKMKKLFTATLIALAAVSLLGCQSAQEKVPANTLVAVKAAAAPSGAADPVWANARVLEVPLSGGRNFGGSGATTAKLKAVYAGDTLYMLVQYSDPTDSKRRGPYQKQADGSWLKLKDPADKGGDDNVYYEDKWAMLWPIGMIKGFDEQGCAALCHLGQGKPFGNKYTANPGEMADIWHMKGSRTAPNGFVDDQYVDNTRFDPKDFPNAGRKNDPGTASGEYNAFPLVNGKPQFMSRDARPLNAGGTEYIKRGEEVAFDDSRFKSGDEVASFIINPLQGDRADVRVVASWKDGMHTSFVTRKLVTGSKFDVQFDNLGARYPFGFAAFDNAQVRHATADDALYMTFGK
jgi:hypothetical protein